MRKFNIIFWDLPRHLTRIAFGALMLMIAIVMSGTTTADDLRFMRWGDQGDGTYANPILNGDFVDSDVEKFGDKWYLITSTNHYAPGMTVMEYRLVLHVELWQLERKSSRRVLLERQDGQAGRRRGRRRGLVSL